MDDATLTFTITIEKVPSDDDGPPLRADTPYETVPDSNGVFLNEWEHSGLTGMLRDFGIQPSKLGGNPVLLATYHADYENSNAYAYVLLTDGDDLFEVEDQHCTCCYGLTEKSWDPVPTPTSSILKRIESGKLGSAEQGGFGDALRQVIADYQARRQQEDLEVYRRCAQQANDPDALRVRIELLRGWLAEAKTNYEREPTERHISILERRVARLTADD